MANNKVEIVEFTDPVCTWCWGSEPVLRKLEFKYKSQLEVKFIMGGLVEDISAFYDSYNNIGGDPEISNRSIVKHWVEASKRHGMPVESEGFSLFSKENPSTYPQNIAYKAAQQQDEEKANIFLRKIREASSAEAKVTSKKSVLIELAADSGLDISKFIEALSNGSAEKDFYTDLEITRNSEARGFPAFQIKYKDRSIMLRGYHEFDDFKAVIDAITDGEIKDISIVPTEESVLDFISRYKSVAPVEVEKAFDLDSDSYTKIIDSLLLKDKIYKKSVGNGYFILPKSSPMACDINSGVCG